MPYQAKQREEKTFDILCEQVTRRIAGEPLMERNRLAAALVSGGEHRVRALDEIVKKRRGDRLGQKLAAVVLEEIRASEEAKALATRILRQLTREHDDELARQRMGRRFLLEATRNR